jgi:hypothetical protein
MIWYRHWLEIRPTLIVVVVMAFGMGGLFTWQIGEGPLARELTGSSLAASLDRRAVLTWAMYVNRLGMSAWLLALFLGSTGLRSTFNPAGSPAYTLTLPVSRRTLMLTRIATTLALGLAFEALWLASHVAILGLRGAPVPYAPLLQSFAFGVPVLAALVSIISALMTFLSKLWWFLVSIAVLLAGAIPIQRLVTLWPLRGDMPWQELAGVVTAGAVALVLTLRYGPDREYA